MQAQQVSPIVALVTPALLALGLSASCASVTTAETNDEQPSGWTGVLSETEFASLHEHSDREEPPRRGAEIDVGGTRAYLSLPEGFEAPIPGVIVIHEWWGLNEHIMHWTDRLAANGYAALAVDLYGGEVATTREDAMRLVKSVDKDDAIEALRNAHRFLREDQRIQAPTTASIGWCFGGGYSLTLALNEPELDACVLYYGRLVTDVDQLASIEADVLGIFGSRDQSIPLDRVADFDEALAAAGKSHEIRMYDAEHAFANPSSARYSQDFAAAAWDEVRTFLARNLRGTP